MRTFSSSRKNRYTNESTFNISSTLASTIKRKGQNVKDVFIYFYTRTRELDHSGFRQRYGLHLRGKVRTTSNTLNPTEMRSNVWINSERVTITKIQFSSRSKAISCTPITVTPRACCHVIDRFHRLTNLHTHTHTTAVASGRRYCRRDSFWNQFDRVENVAFYD